MRCGRISLETYVRTMSALSPHNISLVSHMYILREMLCGHCADIYPGIYVRTMSALYPSLVFSSVYALPHQLVIILEIIDPFPLRVQHSHSKGVKSAVQKVFFNDLYFFSDIDCVFCFISFCFLFRIVFY